MPERRVAATPELPHPERRKHAEPTMIELLTFITHQVSQMRTELADHIQDEAQTLQAFTSTMMKEAFPEGDPIGHRKHHEAVIKAAEAKAAFWEDMARSVSKWGLVGFFGWLIYVAWAAFVKGPQ